MRGGIEQQVSQCAMQPRDFVKANDKVRHTAHDLAVVGMVLLPDPLYLHV